MLYNSLRHEYCVKVATLIIYELFKYLYGRTLSNFNIDYFLFDSNEVKFLEEKALWPIEIVSDEIKVEFKRRRQKYMDHNTSSFDDKLAVTILNHYSSFCYICRIDRYYQNPNEFEQIMTQASEQTTHEPLRLAFANAKNLLNIVQQLANDKYLTNIIPHIFCPP